VRRREMANREKFLSSFSTKNKTRKTRKETQRGLNTRDKKKRQHIRDARRRKQEEWDREE